jgi:tetratricopeptide (TPR) repeat protein
MRPDRVLRALSVALPLQLILPVQLLEAQDVARAEQATTDDYRELLAAALAEYDAAHFEEARALMLRAHAQLPSARTLRGLGMVSFELREYAESVRYFEAALASTERPLTPELRSEAEGLLARARVFTGRVEVSLTPAAAELSVDGAALPERSLTLSVGEHLLVASASGFQREQRRLVLRGGDVLDVRIALAADYGATPRPTATPVPEDTRQVRRRRFWWGSLGAALVAGAAAGLAVALSRRDAQTEAPYRGLSGEPPLPGPSP